MAEITEDNWEQDLSPVKRRDFSEYRRWKRKANIAIGHRYTDTGIAPYLHISDLTEGLEQLEEPEQSQLLRGENRLPLILRKTIGVIGAFQQKLVDIIRHWQAAYYHL